MGSLGVASAYRSTSTTHDIFHKAADTRNGFSTTRSFLSTLSLLSFATDGRLCPADFDAGTAGGRLDSPAQTFQPADDGLLG
eukprot:3136992-Prymnesium_polylepis.1